MKFCTNALLLLEHLSVFFLVAASSHQGVEALRGGRELTELSTKAPKATKAPESIKSPKATKSPKSGMVRSLLVFTHIA